MIYLDRNAPEPYYRQIYNQIIEAIKSGTYPEGMRVPSVRAHAELLNVSRNTVALAYQHLVSEGYLEPRPNSGFFVNALEEPVSHPNSEELATLNATAGEPEEEPNLRYDFNYGNADPTNFPATVWANTARSVCLDGDTEDAYRYSDSQGLYRLRYRISLMLADLCGARVSPEQVSIHSRTRFAINNAAQLFNPTTDVIAVEDPGFTEAVAAFRYGGFTVEPLPVLETDDETFARLDAIKPKVVYLTPANQYPTNEVMTLETRRRFLAWAEENDAYIIEDIYCNEFRYGIDSLPALFSLDINDRVILTGTFSKSLSPALCVSYIVLPPSLISSWLASNTMHPPVSWLTQATLAAFMETHWTKHLNRMRTSFRKKHDTIVAALEREMGDSIEFLDHRAGLHFLVRTKDDKTEEELIELAAEHDVRVYPTHQCWLNGAPEDWDYILLGFSSIKLEDIDPGIAALAQAWGLKK